MPKIFSLIVFFIVIYLNIVLSLQVPNFLNIFGKETSKNTSSTICNNNRTIKKVETKCPLVEDVHCDYKYCDFAHSIPNPIIQNPYKNWAKAYQPSFRPYASICTKCFACMAVSDQINTTLSKLCKDRRKQFLGRNSLNKWEYGEISVKNNLNNLCINGFADFRLRECRGQRFVTYPESGSYPLCSGMDGLWTDKLRKMCMQFVKVYGEWDLLLHFLEYRKTHKERLSDILCRGAGIFGECRNLIINEYEMQKCRSTQSMQKDSSIKVCFQCDLESIHL